MEGLQFIIMSLVCFILCTMRRIYLKLDDQQIIINYNEGKIKDLQKRLCLLEERLGEE
jgi:hypothetical protein